MFFTRAPLAALKSQKMQESLNYDVQLREITEEDNVVN